MRPWCKGKWPSGWGIQVKEEEWLKRLMTGVKRVRENASKGSIYKGRNRRFNKPNIVGGEQHERIHEKGRNRNTGGRRRKMLRGRSKVINNRI